MKLPEMTKVEAKGQIEAIGQQLSALKTQCDAKEIDPRPWVSGDHPLAVQHWRLVQGRIALKSPLKKPSFSTEKRKVMGERLSAARHTRLERHKTAFPLLKPSKSPQIPCGAAPE